MKPVSPQQLPFVLYWPPTNGDEFHAERRCLVRVYRLPNAPGIIVFSELQSLPLCERDMVLDLPAAMDVLMLSIASLGLDLSTIRAIVHYSKSFDAEPLNPEEWSEVDLFWKDKEWEVAPSKQHWLSEAEVAELGELIELVPVFRVLHSIGFVFDQPA